MIRTVYKISPEKAQVIAHNIRWRIMELLSNDETLYAKSIAKMLGLSEQKVHYHLTQLREAGLLVPVGVRPIKRGRAKLFKPVAPFLRWPGDCQGAYPGLHPECLL